MFQKRIGEFSFPLLFLLSSLFLCCLLPSFAFRLLIFLYHVWTRFITDLSQEALHSAQHDWAGRNRNALGRGPRPVLTDGVHSLLASWAVAFFAPRGIRVYAAQNGQRVIPPPIEPLSSRGISRASDYSSATSDEEESESGWGEENEAKRRDMYLPRRERELRSRERARARRRERRRTMREEERRSYGEGDWEVHFVHMTPTIWQAGARPRTYGEPVLRRRR
ncbi:hypothetical protein TREMEDRAFT_63211 [Tremella mesenterica DSM 1558]|uniref:uncharacterized protein n=1 Tax=Tremella mesenterica (strain ATCC 24925 / CBS 8224 / DSM 1558 / NBRC 9311 / NRRL Y-6157 / RJB 2259-6 / UBC 559-6) TaxID=578456 RepID=UPI0003F49670|nr:uncharacterized protein TREMEDRAFT_63211 [Tremella mesenterica DSM 1558]EIW68753.1 hypothetical protein TREMEDRAFT_63211 [Tremella mesenterica DSM 1558]